MKKAAERPAPDCTARLLGLQELQAYLSIGQSLAWKIGRESGALVKIGRRALYDRLKIDAYVDSLRVREK